MNVLPFEGDDEVDSARSEPYSHLGHSELRKVTERAIISNYNEKKARLRDKSLRKTGTQAKVLRLSKQIASSKARSLAR